MERRKARLADVAFGEHHVSENMLHIQHSSQQVTVEYTSVFRCADGATQVPTHGVRGIAVRGKVVKVRIRLQALPFRVSDLTSEAHTLSTVTAFLLKPDGNFFHCAGERVLEAGLKRAFLHGVSAEFFLSPEHGHQSIRRNLSFCLINSSMQPLIMHLTETSCFQLFEMPPVRMIIWERCLAAYDAACPIIFLSLLFYALRGFLFYTHSVRFVRNKLTQIRSVIAITDDE